MVVPEGCANPAAKTTNACEGAICNNCYQRHLVTVVTNLVKVRHLAYLDIDGQPSLLF